MSDSPQQPEWPASEPTPLEPPPGEATPAPPTPTPPPGAPPQGVPPPPGSEPGQWGPQGGQPPQPPTAPPSNQGMPGWAKGCLIVAGIAVVLVIIAVIGLIVFGRSVVNEVESSGQDAEAIAIEYLEDVRADGSSPLACPGFAPSNNVTTRIAESSGQALDGFGILGESAVVGVLQVPEGEVPISVFVTSQLGDELCVADVTLQ